MFSACQSLHPFIIHCPVAPPAGLTMGCVRSKEDKSSPLKYRPEDGNVMSANPHLGHYGPDPTGIGHSPAMKTHNNSYNSHTAVLTPFGGASSVMTPFGGASTSFTSVAVSSPFPSVITGQWAEVWQSPKRNFGLFWNIKISGRNEQRYGMCWRHREGWRGKAIDQWSHDGKQPQEKEEEKSCCH